MSSVTMRRAVPVGLASAAVFAAPTPAMAATSAADPMPYVNFALGCVAGAAVATSIAFMLSLRERKDVTSAHARGVERVRMTAKAAHGVQRNAVDELGERGIRVQPVVEPTGKERVLNDYVDVASHYVMNRGMTTRMAIRAAGVRDTLLSRLGGNYFDDLPVIERADGTVGDVGTSWWDARMSGQIRREAIIDKGESNDVWEDYMPYASTPSNDTAPLAFDGPRVMASVGVGRHGVSGPSPIVRSAYIARKVSEVENGAFPERRSAKELDVGDTFDQALAAMEERMNKQYAMATPTIPASVANPIAASAAPADDGDDQPTGVLPPLRHRVEVDRQKEVPHTEVSAADVVTPNLSPVSPMSTESFLRVIPGGQAVIQERVGLSLRSSRHGARHFRREAVAL